jgi:hypothetical protein
LEDLLRRLAIHAGNANVACAWPDPESLETPYVFDPRTMSSTRLEPDAYVAAAERLLHDGSIVLQFIDPGETVAVSNAVHDLIASPLAYEDLWLAVHTWFPSRVPVGDRVEGVPMLARMLVAAMEQITAVAGLEAVRSLKVRFQIASNSLQHAMFLSKACFRAFPVMLVNSSSGLSKQSVLECF